MSAGADSFPPPLASAAAPGKVILLGEHSVVYGRPALAVPVSGVEARVTVWPGEGPLRILAQDLGRELEIGQDEEDALARAVRVALKQAGLDELPDWAVEVTSTVPIGRGMGSSAAVAVALVRAVGSAADAHFDESTVSGLAYEAERCTHGTPSGIDNAVIAYGRPVHFQAGRMSPLAVGRPFDLVVADTGQAGHTGELVAGVRERRAAQPETYEGWFNRIGALVEAATGALANGEIVTLGHLMNANHLVLQAMRVSTDKLNHLVATARTAGALGAKLSGAGGGGVIVALVTAETAADVAAALDDAGAQAVFRTGIAASP